MIIQAPNHKSKSFGRSARLFAASVCTVGSRLYGLDGLGL